jgi:Domain of unknown function (DUF4190)
VACPGVVHPFRARPVVGHTGRVSDSRDGDAADAAPGAEPPVDDAGTEAPAAEPPPYAAPAGWPPPPAYAAPPGWPPPPAYAAPPGWQPPAPPPGWQPPGAPPPPPYGAPPGWQPPTPPTPPAPPEGYPPYDPAAGAYPPYDPAAGAYPPYGYPPYGYPRPANTNGFAIASLVCSIVLFVLPFLGGAMAITFGILGARGATRSGERGRGLAIAGIVIGVVALLFWSLAVVGAAVSSHSGSSSPGLGALGG